MRSERDQLSAKISSPVILFFGLSGCGKSHVGQLVSALSGRFFYDADEDVTPAMRAALAAQQPFTDAMRDEFFALMAQRIAELQREYGELVVTQAVYKQQHRDYLKAQVSGLELVYVDSDERAINQRVAARAQGISLASAAALRADFELPESGVKRIQNDGDEQRIIQQLNRLYP